MDTIKRYSVNIQRSFCQKIRVLKTSLKLTDLHRWQSVTLEDKGWSERNRWIATIIPKGSSVIDLGAGSQTLRFYLNNCVYQPCDLIKTTPDTMVCDFNAGIYPKTAITYDYIVCSGLLEYIRNPDTFLKRISTLGQNIILSYAVTLPLQQKRWRLSMGWFNNYSQKELEDLFLSLGFNFIICGEWEQQIIYHLWIKKSITPTSVLSLKI